MVYVLLKILSCFPLVVLQGFGAFIAWIICLAKTSMFRVTEINIGLAYSELNVTEQLALVKRSVRNQCYSYVECIKFWGMPNTYNLKRIQQVSGQACLEHAIATQRGVILVMPHLGNWELVNAWLSTQTKPMIMYKPNKLQSINRYILEARQKTNAILVPTNEHGIRALFRHLKQGGVTLILPDHLPKSSGGIYASFFNQDVLSGTIVPKLAQKTQAKVIGISCLRQPSSHTFHIHCTEVCESIMNQDLNTSVRSLNRHMENTIALAPEQYIWSYKRFRNCVGNVNHYRVAQQS